MLAAWIGGAASPGYVPLGLAKVPRGSIPYSIIQHVEIVQGGDHSHMRGIKLDPGLLRHRQGPFSVCELTEARVSGLRSPTFLLRCPESFLDHVPAVMLTWASPQTRPLEACMGPLSSWSLSPEVWEESREELSSVGRGRCKWAKERAPAPTEHFLPPTQSLVEHPELREKFRPTRTSGQLRKPRRTAQAVSSDTRALNVCHRQGTLLPGESVSCSHVLFLFSVYTRERKHRSHCSPNPEAPQSILMESDTVSFPHHPLQIFNKKSDSY